MAKAEIDFKLTLTANGREVNAWPVVVRPDDVLVLHAAPGLPPDQLDAMRAQLVDISNAIEMHGMIVSGDQVQRIAVMRAACGEPVHMAQSEPVESDCDLAGTPHIRCRHE